MMTPAPWPYRTGTPAVPCLHLICLSRAIQVTKVLVRKALASAARLKHNRSMNNLLDEMTEDEMYAIEFSPEELCEEPSADLPEPSAEEPETEYDCPVCHSTELQYAMHYRVSDDDETQELYRCARCGLTGEADERRGELVLRRRNPSRFTNRRTASSKTRSRFSGLATTIVSRVASA